MKILLGYSYHKSVYTDIQEMVESWLSRLKKFGFQVEGFPLTPNPPSSHIYWPKLDLQWKLGDRALLTMYEKLIRKLENFDVFINYNGVHLHPDIIPYLPAYTVYSCFDDPESSDRLSKPVAAYYDLCLVGNIAEVDTYKAWGCKKVEWWPIGLSQYDYDHELHEEDLFGKERDIDISLFCEKRFNVDRIQRLNKYTQAFPVGHYYGNGWKNGILDEKFRIPFLQRTKIGPNFHNSSGPINYRTFYLPANGVMQICDNKIYLGKIFELNKEVIGFDTVEEAIELTNYYLKNSDERKQIALNGYKRVLKDYTEKEIFKILLKHINNNYSYTEKLPDIDIPRGLHKAKDQRAKTRFSRYKYVVQEKIRKRIKH